MACIMKSSHNTCNLDYQLAISVGYYNEQAQDECSKLVAPSHSSSSSAMPYLSLGLPDKVSQSDWLDEKSTDGGDASPRSNRSLYDEAEDFELMEADQLEIEQVKSGQRSRKVEWADLEDSEPENETTTVDAVNAPVVAETPVAVAAPAPASRRARWADLAESEDELIEGAKASSASTAKVKPVPEPKAVARWADIAESEDELSEGSARSAGSAHPADIKEAPEPLATPVSHTSRRARTAQARLADDHHIPTDVAAQGWQTKHGTDTRGVKGGVAFGTSATKTVNKGTGKGAEKTPVKGASKGVGKAGKQFVSKGGGKGGKGGKAVSAKFQCQIVIGIEEDNKFRVVRRLLGSGGENMKNINQQTNAKLRLRGQGSKFLEGDEQKESTDDLMLCISVEDKYGFETAKTMVSELIEGIHHSYSAFCHKSGKACPDLRVQIHEGYREGSR